MNGATEPYDPIADLAHLLCAAQRQPSPLGGVTVPLERLREALGIPELAYPDEAEVAIRVALERVPTPWVEAETTETTGETKCR